MDKCVYYGDMGSVIFGVGICVCFDGGYDKEEWLFCNRYD